MRVHVISDMEGVAGIVKWEQTTGGEPLYEEGRRLYTEEINAAIRGAKSAGATEIVVMDCHDAGKGWTFNSLIHEDLDPACEYVVQNECWSRTTFTAGASLRRSSFATLCRATKAIVTIEMPELARRVRCLGNTREYVLRRKCND